MNSYSPQEIESKWYQFWQQNKFFHSVPDARPHYSIVIPPPNVTGALHLGHALNNSIQDVLIRFHRMLGENACWIPGTDHAGIATQSVVERELYKKEGKTRHDIGRPALLERIWQWKEMFGNRIIDQLKKLGCSCDWDRTCFTMEEKLSQAVRIVFLRLFQEELIYRGKRLINWCPGCRTALSNDELNYREVQSNLWHIRYPIKGTSEFIIVATTRPETMLGDTAVAVSSQDTRYQTLIGKTCILPLMDREIPIISDDILADPTKGTGAVKVTPAHDPNDYACGLRNHLPMINILNEDGTLNANAGKFQGMKAQEARQKIVEELTTLNLLVKIEPHLHDVAHCYRSDDIVEPFLSDQWFVKMQPLVELARQAVLNKEVTFFPQKREEDYLRWLDQTPDWCISRQIWWGHRIPIWYCRDCHPEIELAGNGEPIRIPGHAIPILPSQDDPKNSPLVCPICHQHNLVQDPDVLDTWFSSQLWPLSTFGWPNQTQDLAYYYPTNVLVTARDIIALWVARMVMMGMKFGGKKPFSHVFIHGTIQDENGDIMSKSRGNGFDPVKIIEGGSDHIRGKAPLKNIPAERMEYYPVYGCDALRFGLMSMTSGQGQDIRILVQRTERTNQTDTPTQSKDTADKSKTAATIQSKDNVNHNPQQTTGEVNDKQAKESAQPDNLKHYDVEIPLFEEGRRFCNKIWQAAHGVIFRNCEGLQRPAQPSPYLEDIWLSDLIHHLVADSISQLQEYRIGDLCNALYHFFWDDFCSWYLEIAKPRLWGEQGEASKQYAQVMLADTLETFLRLLHPIMPFLTEELWQTLQTCLGTADKNKACTNSQWPKAEQFIANSTVRKSMDLAREITTAINNIRAEQKLKPGQKLPKAIFVGPQTTLDTLQNLLAGISRLSKVEQIDLLPTLEKPPHTAMRMVADICVYIPLEGVIDFAKEREKLEKELNKVKQQIESLEKKLANPDYTSRAPSHVVARERERLADFQKMVQQLQLELQAL